MSCTNQFCYITGRKSGMATNGMCTCLRGLSDEDQISLKKRMTYLEGAIKFLIKAHDDVDEFDLGLKDREDYSSYETIIGNACVLIGLGL